MKRPGTKINGLSKLLVSVYSTTATNPNFTSIFTLAHAQTPAKRHLRLFFLKILDQICFFGKRSYIFGVYREERGIYYLWEV
jgi:hypothetical protein